MYIDSAFAHSQGLSPYVINMVCVFCFPVCAFFDALCAFQKLFAAFASALRLLSLFCVFCGKMRIFRWAGVQRRDYQNAGRALDGS